MVPTKHPSASPTIYPSKSIRDPTSSPSLDTDSLSSTVQPIIEENIVAEGEQPDRAGTTAQGSEIISNNEDNQTGSSGVLYLIAALSAAFIAIVCLLFFVRVVKKQKRDKQSGQSTTSDTQLAQ